MDSDDLISRKAAITAIYPHMCSWHFDQAKDAIAAVPADRRWEEELRALLLGWRARAMNERAYGVDEDATPSLKCSEELASVLQHNTPPKTT